MKVGSSILISYDSYRIAVYKKYEVHKKPRRSSVAVNERMDCDKFIMGIRSNGHRMYSLLRFKPFDKLFHFYGYDMWQWKFSI